MSEIPKKWKDKLPIYSEKLGRSTEELSTLLTEQYTIMKEVDPELPNSKLWQRSYSRFLGNLRRQDKSLYSPAPLWTGLIWGDGGLLDFIDLAKKKAISMYNDPLRRDQAISQSIVSYDGIPLDTREKITYGKEDNPNYGNPYPEDETSFYRAIYGVCAKGTDLSDGLTFFRMNINGEEAKEVTFPPRGVAVTFRANPKRNQEYGFMDLNAVSGAPAAFTEAANQDIPDIYEELQKGTWAIYKLSDLPMAHATYENDRSVPILLEANVGDIGKEVHEKTGNRALWLDDPEIAFEQSGVLCFIDGSTRINFGLDSRLLLPGRVDKRIGFDGESESYIFNAGGYYALPDWLIEPTE